MSGGLISEWSQGISNATNTLNNHTSNALSNITEGMSKLKVDVPTSSDAPWGSDFDMSKLNIRDKLKVEMPDWMQRAGVFKIDFGSAFLPTPAAEATFAKAQGLVTDVAGSITGAAQFITPEALNLAVDTLTFIITDLVTKVLGYATQLFTKYASPDFAIQLVTDITKKTLQYMTADLKNPADIMKECMEDMQKQLENANKENSEKLKSGMLQKVQGWMSKVMDFINKWADKIRPYSETIARYLQNGPEYVLTEIEALYVKYFNQGFSWVKVQIAQLEQLLNEYIDYAAMIAGMWAADIANQAQEWMIRNTMQKAKTGIGKASTMALALINKVTLQLLAVLGG